VFQRTVTIQLSTLDFIFGLLQRGHAYLEVPTMSFLAFPHKKGVGSEQRYERAGCLANHGVKVPALQQLLSAFL